MKAFFIAAVFLVFLAGGVGAGYIYITNKPANKTLIPSVTDPALINNASNEHGKAIVVPDDASICAEHFVPEVICPFCQPALIEERGHCGAHDVAEALCTSCSPVLIAAFKVEGDWCDEHELPESQCALCGGGGAEALEDASGSASSGNEICAEHHVPESICAFCDPSLIEKLGHCGGHDVPEAFCTRCNAALIPAFKAEGDWCAEHDLPESQCLECNPSSGG